MSFTPSTQQLCGLSLDVAELYGKPHIGAHYEGKSVKSHKKDDDSTCLICSKTVQSVHHAPPLSKGHKFTLKTPNGVFELKPSLFALCGADDWMPQRLPRRREVRSRMGLVHRRRRRGLVER